MGFICYKSLTLWRLALLAKKEVRNIKVFFSVSIFIIKQSMLLRFLQLLRIVNSSDWKHKKREYRIYSQFFLRADYGPLAWFWESFGLDPNEPFHAQHYGTWLNGNKRLCESPLETLPVSNCRILLPLIGSE